MKTIRNIVLAAIIAQSAVAATFHVTTAAPAGPGSLSEAITAANAAPGADVIALSLRNGDAAIDASAALPAITEAVTLTSDSAVTIRGAKGQTWALGAGQTVNLAPTAGKTPLLRAASTTALRQSVNIILINNSSGIPALSSGVLLLLAGALAISALVALRH